MDVLTGLLVLGLGLLIFLVIPKSKSGKPPSAKINDTQHRVLRRPAPPRPATYVEPKVRQKLKGKCWVIDGDTIVIDKVHIRLAGIDAPELNHPWGRNSKSAMIRLCKGQVITAELHAESTYDRAVATCYLPDGRDLAAELVSMGLAIDWPKFSGGRYKHLEPEGIRKKLWRADAKQKGLYDEKRHG